MRISRPPTTGGSGWCTSGSRTSSNYSRRSWSPISSCCSGVVWSGSRPRSSTSTSCCTRGRRRSAPCTISTSPARRRAHGVGAFFSAAEVIPLTFLTVEAWSFIQLGAHRRCESRATFPHRWAVLFLASVGFWNFLGAGVFGFLINLPIVSYYEIGTALTSNHGHAAMMGVYGMLAVASRCSACGT